MNETPRARDGFAGALEAGGRFWRQPRLRLGAVIAVAVAAGFIAWLAIDRGGKSSTPAQGGKTVAAGVGPVAVSQAGLATLGRSLKGPIYWAGPKAGYTYEVTETRTGRFYVRYLPPSVKVGDTRTSFLIIATYPFPNSFRALERVAQGREIALPGAGIAVVDRAYPKSVHVAFPGVDYQVEVYDPSPQHSLEVAVSGDVRPVR